MLITICRSICLPYLNSVYPSSNRSPLVYSNLSIDISTYLSLFLSITFCSYLLINLSRYAARFRVFVPGVPVCIIWHLSLRCPPRPLFACLQDSVYCLVPEAPPLEESRRAQEFLYLLRIKGSLPYSDTMECQINSSLFLSIYLSIYIYVRARVCVCVCAPILYINLILLISIYLSINLPRSIFICKSIYVSISMYL